MGRRYLLLSTVDQLVLIGALIAGTNALILPQSLGMLVEFLKRGHRRETEEKRVQARTPTLLWMGPGEGSPRH